MIKPEDILSMTDFKRDTAAHMKRMKKTKRPSVLTVNGRAEAVVMDPAAYSRMLQVIERADAVAGIRRGLADAQAGRTSSVGSAFERIRNTRRLRRSA